MNFDLTEEQRLVQQAAHDVASREIAPRAAELDRSARWPAEIVARLGELGFLGVTVPVALGGAGKDHVGLVLALEEISAACAGCGAIAAATAASFCEPLLRFGSEAQKREILAPAAAGKALGTLARNDTRGGKPTVAEKQADGSFLLDGKKSFVTAGAHADHVLVLAGTGPDGAHTALLVPRGAAGLTASSDDEKMGLRAAPSCTLTFERVHVPATHVLGEEGGGLAVVASALDAARIALAAQAVGIARAAIDEAVGHLGGDPRAPGFAREIKADQTIHFLLADMAVDIDAARLLARRAARLRDRGLPHAAEASMAKLFASEMASRVTHRAIQILGDPGFTAERGAERHYRDARLTEMDQGASEIQRGIIASSLLEAT